jgi:hypothetical protein
VASETFLFLLLGYVQKEAYYKILNPVKVALLDWPPTFAGMTVGE